VALEISVIKFRVLDSPIAATFNRVRQMTLVHKATCLGLVLEHNFNRQMVTRVKLQTHLQCRSTGPMNIKTKNKAEHQYV
jgi:hypothetical protein